MLTRISTLVVTSAIAGLLLNVQVGVLCAKGDDISYSACPLIGAYYPAPTISKSSEVLNALGSELQDALDKLVVDDGSDVYGPISPNTTSFSVALFGGAESMKDDPAFFEYHYTSPQDQLDVGTNLGSDTRMPLGDVTMVFTVYAWLIKMGDNWDTPITEYLPELRLAGDSNLVSWEDVTIGALAGHMSGLVRESGACVVGKSCDWKAFVDKLAVDPFVFLPDTTPIVSFTPFQLLVFAMQRQCKMRDFSTLVDESIARPLNMTMTGVLGHDKLDIYAIDGLNMSQAGEPGAASVVSSIRDLSLAGHSILSSSLASTAITRRWLHDSVDTSNLRNGVGRPWEVYRSGSSPTSPVLDVMAKTGWLGQYASYFGLAPDFNVGFAILAHDSTVDDRKLDLNVIADVVSQSLGHLQQTAAQETALRFGGSYRDGNDSVAVLNTTDNGPGLAVQKLRINGVDLRARTASKLGMQTADLDFRLYPTNVEEHSRHQFVAVFQDQSALIDAGTPTCITWQDVGAVAGVEYRFVFELIENGMAGSLQIPGLGASLTRVE